MVAVKRGSGWDFFWINLKIPDTDLNGQSNLSWHCYQFFYFGDIKKIISYNILMMLNKILIQCFWVGVTTSSLLVWQGQCVAYEKKTGLK